MREFDVAFTDTCLGGSTVASLVRAINPGCVLVDPAAGVAGVPGDPSNTGPNRLTIALTGAAISLEDVQTQTPVLFPGWDIEATGAFTLTGADTRARGAR